MEREDAADDHNLKPQQSDDEDSDFPEFEFPVGDCVDVDDSRLVASARESSATQVENGDGTMSRPIRALVDDSPKKMPPAIRSDTEQVISTLGRIPTARLSEPEPEPSHSHPQPQPEISKHVVAEESKIPSTLPASQRKVLHSNPSFKSLVTILGEPLEFRSSSMERRNGESTGEVGEGENAETGAGSEKAPSTPPSKKLSGILSRVNAKVAAAQSDFVKSTPERERASTRPATSTLSVNALVEKFSTGARNKSSRVEGTLASLSTSPRNLTSPRRTVADRSRSPVPLRHSQDSQPNATPLPMTPTPRTISSPRRTSDRSLSPVPRSWKDSVYGDMPRNRRPNLSKPDPCTPPPRFLTPTRAAALKAVKPPPTPANNSSKSLQFTTAFGITTAVKHSHHEPARKSCKESPGHVHAKSTTPSVTEPAGFNFRTDERAERRKDFYSKLEERLKVKEAERKRAEARAQEEKESQLRELRKSLTYKANPVPRFYQEPAPAPAEIRRTAPTRAKSPNFTAPRRRDSCPGSTVSDTSSSRTSPLRTARLLRCASLESNSASHSYKASVPKPKQPFRPV